MKRWFAQILLSISLLFGSSYMMAYGVQPKADCCKTEQSCHDTNSGNCKLGDVCGSPCCHFHSVFITDAVIEFPLEKITIAKEPIFSKNEFVKYQIYTDLDKPPSFFL